MEPISPTPSHPLSILLASEISSTVSLLKSEKQFTSTMRFVHIYLKEPSKSFILSYKSGDPFTRETFSVILDKGNCQTYEAIVNLTEKKIVSFVHKPGVQPSVMLDEFFDVDELVRNDPQVIAACAKKGLTNMDLLMVEPWSAGNYGIEEDQGKRLIRGIAWMRNHPTDHYYAHPMEIAVKIDASQMKVIEVEIDENCPLPKEDFPYRADQVSLRDAPLKPLQIIQKEGPSFVVKESNLLLWENFSIRFGFNGREGLLLNQVSFFDRFTGKDRSILYRLSMTEMIASYGDPNFLHKRKHAFDEGEYGLGILANSLTLGCDCLGEIKYFDVWVNNSKGEPVHIPNAICLHEEDYGIGWKHTDWRLNQVETRRSRRLVLSSIYTLANYEYGVFYYFYLDGTIQVEIKLTGVLNTQALPKGVTKYPYGQRIGPNLVAGYHQHYFNFRIDPCVDGLNNSVEVTHAKSEPMDPVKNPYGNSFIAVSETLKTEEDAKINISSNIGQQVLIRNPNVLNYLDEPVAFKLIPGETCVPFHDPEGFLMKRAGFLQKNLWVTPYEEKERFPAGEYPNQRREPDGLPVWTKNNRNIENSDIVLWYTVGHQHYPRLEDWPVMPVDYAGFTLKPFGFFKYSPIIDLHPNKPEKKCCEENK